MEYTEDIHIHIIPVYYKRRIEYRAEVATCFDTFKIHVQTTTGEWELYAYCDPQNMFYKSYPTKEDAIKVAQEYADKLRVE